jgi:signal transduction histidine kinase
MRYRAKHKDISMELANLFLAVGDYKQAASYFQRYALIKDTLLTEANTKNIAQMQNKYDLEKKENENKLLRKQQQLNKVLLRQQFWTIVSIGVFLASLVIISIILYRRQSEKENNNALLRRQNSEIQTHKSELETQAIALKELNTTKDKLFAIIGHDLRSPINSLQGLMNLLNDNNISPQEFMTFIGKFKNSVEHVSFTLNNLLLWANSQLQGLQTRPRVINLYQLATENLNFLGEIAKNKNIELHNQLSEDISAWADKDQINLIFRNLISNALKFTPNHGQVFISGKDKGEFTEVVVSDTGIGIGAESIEKLFKKESHFTTYGTSGEKGTGLGLLLCQEMAEKNNGKIWLESDLGKGTTFKFILPAYLQSPA